MVSKGLNVDVFKESSHERGLGDKTSVYKLVVSNPHFYPYLGGELQCTIDSRIMTDRQTDWLTHHTNESRQSWR